MTQCLPSPRDWLLPAHDSYGEPRSMDQDIDDICMSMEQLLRKGDRYQAPHSLRHISLKEQWYWAKSKNLAVRYLDASCLLFGANHNLLEVVDYANRYSTNNKDYNHAVKHSGDQLFDDEYMGLHTIDVDLASLPLAVREMYITISAFAPSRLSDIVKPSVSVVDRETQASLCTYELEEQPKEVRSQYTSVIMCRVYRSQSNESVWEVEAIGHLGQGAAGSYSAIVHYITHTLPLANSLSNWGI